MLKSLYNSIPSVDCIMMKRYKVECTKGGNRNWRDRAPSDVAVGAIGMARGMASNYTRSYNYNRNRFYSAS